MQQHIAELEAENAKLKQARESLEIASIQHDQAHLQILQRQVDLLQKRNQELAVELTRVKDQSPDQQEVGQLRSQKDKLQQEVQYLSGQLQRKTNVDPREVWEGGSEDLLFLSQEGVGGGGMGREVWEGRCGRGRCGRGRCGRGGVGGEVWVCGYTIAQTIVSSYYMQLEMYRIECRDLRAEVEILRQQVRPLIPRVFHGYTTFSSALGPLPLPSAPPTYPS